jgi:acetyl esterase
LLDLYNQVKPPPGLSMEERRDRAPIIPRPPRGSGLEAQDHTLPVDGGEMRVRVLRPDGFESPGPAYVYIHGGGWVFGDLDGAEAESGVLATELGALIVLVDYRLAPEHKFPIPLYDCLAAYQWVIDQAPVLGVDLDRLVVGGGSAGGNLTAALCILLRDRGLPAPRLQFLDVPALDLTLGSPSQAMDAPEAWLGPADVAEAKAFYLTSDEDAMDPRASPLLAEDLSGLPPAVILVAEYDPVRDDGERYARRLQEADVPAATFRIVTHAHGTYTIPGTLTSQLIHDLRVNTLRRAFEGRLLPATAG